MRPITHRIPKPMVPLRGKPKLQWTLENLPDEIDKVLVVINHLGEQIKNHFGGEFCGRPIEYALQQKLNGTGGALHACKKMLDKRFLVMMGDDLYCCSDIAKMAQEKLALLGFDSTERKDLGMIYVDKEGNYRGIVEKGRGEELDKLYPKKMICTGLYALDQRFFEYPLVPIGKGEFGLPQTLVSMTADHEVKVVEAKDWLALGREMDIEDAEKRLDAFFG